MGVIDRYIKLSGGYLRLLPLLLIMVFWAAFSFGTQWFLQYWTTVHEDTRDVRTFATVYILLNLGVTFSDFLRNLILQLGNLRASRELNYLMVFRLIHASVNKFFDRIPIGRILNRFSRDFEIIDGMLGFACAYFVLVSFQLLNDFLVTALASSPIVIPFIMLYSYLSFRVQQRYMSLQREIGRAHV